jgi:PBP1b-binding outer membrane lipoprotein LpoB
MIFLRISSLALFLVALVACSTTVQTHDSISREGYYQINQIRRQDFNSKAVILGSINDGQSKKRFAQLAMVLLNDQSIFADSTGHYKLEVEPGAYEITGRNIFYDNVKTRRIHVKPGDSITVNFYLFSRPTVN